jgi:hypothetical protein
VQPKLRKRIYTVLGLLTLAYTIFGSCITVTSVFDYFGPPSEYRYDIRNNPIGMTIVVLVTGIGLFLLFLFLEKRVK